MPLIHRGPIFRVAEVGHGPSPARLPSLAKGGLSCHLKSSIKDYYFGIDCVSLSYSDILALIMWSSVV